MCIRPLSFKRFEDDHLHLLLLSVAAAPPLSNARIHTHTHIPPPPRVFLIVLPSNIPPPAAPPLSSSSLHSSRFGFGLCRSVCLGSRLLTCPHKSVMLSLIPHCASGKRKLPFSVRFRLLLCYPGGQASFRFDREAGVQTHCRTQSQMQ